MTARRFARLLSLAIVMMRASDLVAAGPIQFDRDIRPILSENCFFCHGPDAAARQADLRLDTKEGATKLVDGHAAVVPGKIADSALIQRITSSDPDELMPPRSSNRKLTPQQRELLARWIAEGAVWGEHWAFVKPQRPVAPQVATETGLVRNAIDTFILQRLQQEGLTASPEADRARLLRRVMLDLTGIPPTLDDLDAFLSDTSPDAYERAVDRLLQSPRYGERMVWEWLDAARYADTNGYQGDPTRAMWYWRDWAVAALNVNQPFDRFTIEQLAGDLLPNPAQPQLIATGFHRNHMINGEGGRIAEESRVDYVQDRVETTGAVWLGLTFNCCRCHDHKYDPLAQKEYYQLSAFFNSVEESGGNDAGGLANPVMSLATDEQQQRLAALRDDEKDANRKRNEVEKAARDKQAEWEAVLAASRDATAPFAVQWTTLSPSSMSARQGTVLKKETDGSLVATGPNPERETFSLIFPPPEKTITAIRLEALPDDRLPANGPGRAENGNFVLGELNIEVYGRAYDLQVLRADFEQDGWPAKNVIDGNNNTGWAVSPAFGKPHELIVMPQTPLAVPNTEVLTVRLAFESEHVQHVLGRFRVQITDAPPELVRGMPPEVLAALAKPVADRNKSEQDAVTNQMLDTTPDVQAARKAADQAKAQRDKYERSLPRTMVMRERKEPRETFILVRGAYDKYADKVTHGTPAVLPPLKSEGTPNRLALAEWLVNADNPLTARVVVNRIWQTFFGTGLVKTAEDFGSQGEKPSHPELLDWLACEFVDSGWDVKHIHRLIVTSATYRQSSRVTPALAERDPENRLLARGPRYRWPSWMLRDQALAVAGVLEERIGGPPVKGYQPPGIWEEATFGKIRYEQDHGPALYRRSVYQFWRRIVGPTVFFDVAARQNCT
ncbi:MAG TPA: PSD1 and planctomycete cytochrome C domain-containing protein, partial [Planctomycetaceae bacterium]|nr:PSD1 and planctomycete cytochrome C domain-containing protein [Planctomycetaceae bacterium]